MKNFLLAGFAALLAWGCSETKGTEEAYNPYRPISGLFIPSTVVAGQPLVMKGRGFDPDCEVALQLNGETSETLVEVVEVDAEKAVVAIPEDLQMGLYAIILAQNDVVTIIGGVNVYGDKFLDGDFEMYVLAGPKSEIYPASVSKQMRSRVMLPNSSLAGTGYPVYVEVIDDTVYQITMGEEKDETGRDVQVSKVGSYNLTTQAREPLTTIPNFFAAGQIDGVFHLLKVDKANKIYTLVKVEGGVETTVKTFDVGAAGGSKILNYDMRFVYHAASQSVIIYGIMGTGSDVGKATFTLNLSTGVVTQNGGDGAYKYWFVTAGDELYCFAVKTAEDTVSTQVLRITDPAQWTVKGTGVEPVTTYNSGFENPVYSPITERIYGIDNMEEFGVLMTFDPALGKFEGRKWVNPGMSGYFYAPQQVLPEN